MKRAAGYEVSPIKQKEKIIIDGTHFKSTVKKFVGNAQHNIVILTSPDSAGRNTEVIIHSFDSTPVPYFEVKFESILSHKYVHSKIDTKCVSRQQDKALELCISYAGLGARNNIKTTIKVHLPNTKFDQFRLSMADAMIHINPCPRWDFESVEMTGKTGDIKLYTPELTPGNFFNLTAKNITLVTGDGKISGSLALRESISMVVHATKEISDPMAIEVLIENWSPKSEHHDFYPKIGLREKETDNYYVRIPRASGPVGGFHRAKLVISKAGH